MNLYDPVDVWRIPASVLPYSIAEMAPDGRRGCEGIVLWLGIVTERMATITHLVGLHGPKVVKRPDHLRIDPDLFNELADLSEEVGSTLVGQIHSHPGTFVDLSETDKRYGVSSPHYFSVVAPYYAQDPRTSWAECGVHVFHPTLGFQRLSPERVATQIQVVSGARPPLIRLGVSK